MLSNQITSLLAVVQSGGQAAPMLLSESHVCELWELLYGREIMYLDDIVGQSVADFLYYDCGNRDAGNHKVKNIREFAEKLYQKPSGDVLLVVFRNIEILTDESAHALLRIFEDIPPQVLILLTSPSPQKIIPTLLSRTLIIDSETSLRGENPMQWAIDDFLTGKPETLFKITLAPSKESKFTRSDALWIVTGLQDALECGRIPVRHAKSILKTRFYLETTNTIAKYLIDQLLITLSCE